MTNQTMPGVPAGGFKTIGQIRPTNDLVVHLYDNAMGIALDLLASHTHGAPVVGDKGEFKGFISEFNLLRALKAEKDLNTLRAEDIMVRDRDAVTDDTSIEEAMRIMEKGRLQNLPVEKNGKVAYSITRHDLLRAWIGLGVDIEA